MAASDSMTLRLQALGFDSGLLDSSIYDSVLFALCSGRPKRILPVPRHTQLPEELEVLCKLLAVIGHYARTDERRLREQPLDPLNDLSGDGRLGLQRQGFLAVGRDQRDFVGIDLESGIGARHVIRHDEIDLLLALLAARARHDIGGLGGEPDQKRPLGAGTLASQLRQDVRRTHQRQRQRVRVLVDFLSRRVGGRVVGHGGRHDDDIGLGRTRDNRIAHFRGGRHANQLDSGRRLELRWSADEYHIGAPTPGGARKRITHLPARPIADESHRVDGFARRPCRDDDGLAAQRARRREQLFGRSDDIRRLGEPPFADPAACEISGARLDEVRAAFRQHLEVPLHGRVLEHVRVHRRRHEHRGLRGEVQRRQEVVGDAVGEFAEDVRGRRRDDEQVDARCERDVLDVGIRAGLELALQHAMPRDRLEGELADELPRRARHDRDHVVPKLLEAAHHFDRFVGADSAAHADSNHGHGFYPWNVCRTSSACGRMHCSFERSASTIDLMRSTHDSSWSLMTT